MVPNKNLYRSRENKMVFGVCGGLGEYFVIDPVIIRILFVILIFWGGVGVLIYLILAIIIPEESGKDKKGKGTKNTESAIEENIEKLVKEVEEEIEKSAENITKKTKGATKKHINSGEFFLGTVMLLVGVFMLFNNFFPFFEFQKLWPLILILLSMFILFRSGKEQK